MSDFPQSSQPVAVSPPQSQRAAGWHEIAAWAEARGLKFEGNVEPINRRRRAEGRKPFLLMAGPLRKGLR